MGFARYKYSITSLQNMKAYLISILLLISIAIFYSCDDKEIAMDLIATKDTIFLNDQDTIDNVKLSVNTKIKADYRITQFPTWLSLNSNSGVTNQDSIKVKLLKRQLKTGITKGTISIISEDAGKIEIPVIATIGELSPLKLSLQEIDFKDTICEIDLIMENTNSVYTYWNISKSVGWLSLSKNQGYFFDTNEKYTLKLTCSRDYLEKNNYKTSLTIRLNYKTSIEIPVKMVVPQLSTMKLSKSDIVLDYFENEKEFYLKNTGNTAYTWTASDQNYFTLNPNTGYLNKGDSVKINFKLNRTNISKAGIFDVDMKFSNSNNFELNKHITIKNHIENKWLIDKNIIAADFCRTSNKIICVSTSPNVISIIDPEEKTIKDYNLSYTPQCLSVSSNGKTAVVGHDKKITIFDINKGTTNELPTSYNASDITVSNEGYAYVFPKNREWKTKYTTTNLTCLGINISTGQECYNQLGNLSQTYGKVPPNDKSLYYVDGYSNYIYRFNIDQGKITYPGGGYYYGYSVGWNFWFSENGDRIFTSGKQVLKAEYIPLIDRVPNGTINCTGQIKSLFHVNSTGRIYLTTTTGNYSSSVGGNVVNVYNFYDLDLVKTYMLEDYMIKNSNGVGEIKPAESNYVFAKQDGTELYVITSLSNATQNWAVQMIQTK